MSGSVLYSLSDFDYTKGNEIGGKKNEEIFQ